MLFRPAQAPLKRSLYIMYAISKSLLKMLYPEKNVYHADARCVSIRLRGGYINSKYDRTQNT